MVDLEELVLAEARRQGFRPNADAIRQAVIDLAGCSLTEQQLIAVPGKGSVSPADFVRSLQIRMPQCFGALADDLPVGTLTERMKFEVSQSKRQSMPSDWSDVRAKYAPGTLTAKMMDELAAARRNGRQY